MPANRFLEQLQVLVDLDVEFIIVGGVAAVIEGAPIVTLDLDIVYHRTPDNTARLLTALGEMNARYRDPAGRHIVPDGAKLAESRTHLFDTDLGQLDVLTTIGDDLAYPDLVPHANAYEVARLQVLVLDLETVIKTKRQANRDKDRAALPVLLRTLEIKDESPTREE